MSGPEAGACTEVREPVIYSRCRVCVLEGGKLPGLRSLHLVLRAMAKPSSTGATQGDTRFRKTGLEAADLARQEAVVAWTRVVAVGTYTGHVVPSAGPGIG